MKINIQSTIREYMGEKTEPSIFDLNSFVGMIETGEAIYLDFEAVGGKVLAAQIAKSKQNRDEIREEARKEN